MFVYKGVLPTLSQILALDELSQQQKLVMEDASLRTSSQPNLRWAETIPSEPEQLLQTEQHQRAEREWCSAIAALNTLLQQGVESYPVAVSQHRAQPTKGVILSGPAPILESPDLASNFSNWIFTPDAFMHWDSFPFHLLPSTVDCSTQEATEAVTLPLLADDPLTAEHFCLVLTTEFSLAVVLGRHPSGQVDFQFCFNPDVIQQVWRLLRSRVMLTGPQYLKQLDLLIEQFAPVVPDYRVVVQFSRLMLAHRPEATASSPVNCTHTTHGQEDSGSASPQAHELTRLAGTAAQKPHSQPSVELPPVDGQVDGTQGQPYARPEAAEQSPSSPDAVLLRAMAHEIRTPLTTIRTLTRSLLKRKDLDPKVLQRLSLIDRECTQQIDRFNLIFRAVELETTDAKQAMGHLSAMSLEQIFRDSIPLWQQQARQRNINLEVLLPQSLPSVMSDPTMLNQILTGLIERFTHSLPIGSDLQLGVMLAGHQLKLQFKANPHSDDSEPDSHRVKDSAYTFAQGIAMSPQHAFKSIGQLLMVQPETGNLSLSLSVTKNLFQALGGKLIVRQRPQQGEVLTIFLPLDRKPTEV